MESGMGKGLYSQGGWRVWGYELVKCDKCGNPDIWDRKEPYCSRCAELRVADAIRQMREKEGPIYEKWKRRLKERMERI